jgi:alkylhydroperoxidase family enzyme
LTLDFGSHQALIFDSWTAEREQLKEEKVAMAIELAASRSDKELIQALHRRLSVEEDQRLKLDMSVKEVVELVVSHIWLLYNESGCKN